MALKLFEQLLLYLFTNLINSLAHFPKSYGLPIHFDSAIHLLTTLFLIKFKEMNLIFVLFMQSQWILVNFVVLFHYFARCYFLLTLLFYLLHHCFPFVHFILNHFTHSHSLYIHSHFLYIHSHFLYLHSHSIESYLCFDFSRISIYKNQFNFNIKYLQDSARPFFYS